MELDDLDRLIDPSELLEADDKKRITILFARRNALLQLARAAYWRQQMYEQRARIADLFAHHGGDRHAQNADFFRNLPSADALQEHAIEPRQKAPPKQIDWNDAAAFEPPGFYIVGPGINFQQGRDIRTQNPAGVKDRKIGNPITIGTMIELYRLKEDFKPIFIHLPLTQELLAFLQMFLHHRPDCCDRLFHVSWETGKMETMPLRFGVKGTEVASEQTGIIPVVELDAALVRQSELLHAYLNHEPQVGEVHLGTVTYALGALVVVALAPDVEGFAKIDDRRATFMKGQRVPVRVVQFLKPFHRGMDPRHMMLSLDVPPDRKPVFDVKTLPNMNLVRLGFTESEMD